MSIKRWKALPALAAGLILTGMVHNHLVKSVPNSGETLTAAPREIKLWFAEKPEVAFTSVTLMKGDSTRIATIRATGTDDSMAVAIPLDKTPLPAGDYLVGWRTASDDGHAVRGVFRFSISP
jgi:methionine-rich copper-binding protein CopC